MKSILLTGASGFIGQNILPLIREFYHVSAPTRLELNLLDSDAVRKYLKKGHFDAVVHLANPTGHNLMDSKTELFERSLRVFTSLEHCVDLYGKMIYVGSGAEYGKHRDISMITEAEFVVELPKDAYGLSRYLMSNLAKQHDNIINLRLFACYGPSDSPHKLIPSIMNCINKGTNIELRQDAWFDFLYVNDVLPVITHFLENHAKYKVYNLCSGKRELISTIADEVRKQMNSNAKIVFQKDGLNLEYTASNYRLRNEIPNYSPRSISEGIKSLLLNLH